MKFQFTNPSLLDHDCAVIAIMLALDVSYLKAKNLVRPSKDGTEERNIVALLKRRGWKYHKTPDKRRIPKLGRVILNFQGDKTGHVSAVIDNLAYDWSDPFIIAKDFKMKYLGFWKEPNDKG